MWIARALLDSRQDSFAFHVNEICLLWCLLCTNCVRCGRSTIIRPENGGRFFMLFEFGNFTSEKYSPWQKIVVILKKLFDEIFSLDRKSIKMLLVQRPGKIIFVPTFGHVMDISKVVVTFQSAPI